MDLKHSLLEVDKVDKQRFERLNLSDPLAVQGFVKHTSWLCLSCLLFPLQRPVGPVAGRRAVPRHHQQMRHLQQPTPLHPARLQHPQSGGLDLRVATARSCYVCIRSEHRPESITHHSEANLASLLPTTQWHDMYSVRGNGGCCNWKQSPAACLFWGGLQQREPVLCLVHFSLEGLRRRFFFFCSWVIVCLRHLWMH